MVGPGNFSDLAALFPTLGANSEVQVAGPGNFNDFAALVPTPELVPGANSGSEITDVRRVHLSFEACRFLS